MKKAIAWGLCLLWMGVIFGMSSMPGAVSQAQSESVSGGLLELYAMLFSEHAALSIQIINHVVRKGAHMAEYAVLFLLLVRALRLSGVARSSLTSFILCVLYAATDELHQGFTFERAPMLSDVGIDALGAGAAWLLHAALRALHPPKSD